MSKSWAGGGRGLSSIPPSEKKPVYIYIYIHAYMYIYWENPVYIGFSLCICIYKYIYIYIYVCVCVCFCIYIYIMYIIYSVQSCNNTSYGIWWGKILAFLHQHKFMKLYWTFNCNVLSVKYAWILNKKNERTKILNKINSRS